ncbi:Hypothetical protein D9617_5g068340 [Elsinoe fawcettii]|nr:Hypothetical protein D9617_5g068340 [Elsinoe fawcettii]
MDLTTEQAAADWLSKELGKPCQRTTRLTEGYGSFLYRAELEDNSTVIVKHVQPFAARSQQFALDPERLTYEHAFLTEVAPHLPPSTSIFPLRLPDPISFSQKDHTLLISDHGECPSLKAFLTSPPPDLTAEEAKSIGDNLATFLASVHNLTLTRPGILDSFKDNDGGRKVSALVYFGNLVSRAAKYDFEAPWLTELAMREEAIVLGKGEATKGKEVLTVGDFWPGNVLVADLLPESGADEREGREVKELVALDFELAKPGMKEFDIGQMTGELWMVRHFSEGQREVENMAGIVLAAFLRGYAEKVEGNVNWNRVAIRAGSHLVVICPMGWEAKVGSERVAEVVGKGVELCRRGWGQEVKGYQDIFDLV